MASMPETNLSGNPLAIIGQEDMVSGFKALGFKVYCRQGQKDLSTIFAEIVQQNCAVCLIEDTIYRESEDQINTYKSLPLPIFIPFSKDIEASLLENIIKDIRIRATGAF